jgi:hypothetical protein
LIGNCLNAATLRNCPISEGDRDFRDVLD